MGVTFVEDNDRQLLREVRVCVRVCFVCGGGGGGECVGVGVGVGVGVTLAEDSDRQLLREVRVCACVFCVSVCEWFGG